jgi:hypothetical protein
MCQHFSNKPSFLLFGWLSAEDVGSLLAICWQLANILKMSIYRHHSSLDLKSVGSAANSFKSLYISSFNTFVGIVGTFSK